MDKDAAQIQMPQYESHKRVWALKIKAVINAPPSSPPGSMALEFNELGYAPLTVRGEYIDKHQPYAGGYYVKYQDGYESFSPAKAFEEGYTRL